MTIGRISKTVRFEVLARDGFRCRYCGADAASAVLQIDHFTPRAKGGSDDIDNLRAACADCNQGKSDRVLIPAATGFDLSPDMGPARMARAQRAASFSTPASEPDPDRHWITSSILDIGDGDGGMLLAKVFCETHGRREWIWLDEHLVAAINGGGPEAGWVRGKAKPA